MPVRKFRTLDEMRQAQQLAPDDPRLPTVIRFNWELAWDMAGRFIPPRGVFKFRSIEEMNAHRRAWEDERIRRCKERNETPKADR